MRIRARKIYDWRNFKQIQNKSNLTSPKSCQQRARQNINHEFHKANGCNKVRIASHCRLLIVIETSGIGYD